MTPPLIVVEKPFCLTRAVGGVPGETRPARAEWSAWRGRVFAFDHYFMRLWALQNLEDRVAALGFGHVVRLIFRLREYVADFAGWPAARPTWQAGAVQDLGAHAAPLFLMFGRPGSGRVYIVHRVNAPAHQSPPTYFAFTQPWIPIANGGEALDYGERFQVDVGIGWYLNRVELPDSHVFDKFFCVEYEWGRIWADLGPPFLVLLQKRPACHPDDWAYLYPSGAGVERVTQFAAADPVSLMIFSLLTSGLFNLPQPPIGVLPISSGNPLDITGKEIMKVIDPWEFQYRWSARLLRCPKP